MLLDFSGTSLKFIIRERRGKGIKVWNVLFVLLSVMYAGFFRQAILLEKSTRQISESMAAGMLVLRSLPDLWKEGGSDHTAGRLPEVCTGYCDRKNGLWKFHEWYPSASYPLCGIRMYPWTQFSDFYGISWRKGNCCFCGHDHCF